MASAQRYASLANLSCATSSLCLSVSAAKAVLVERLLSKAARAAVANLSRNSWCSLVKVPTCNSLTSGVEESLKTALRRRGLKMPPSNRRVYSGVGTVISHATRPSRARL